MKICAHLLGLLFVFQLNFAAAQTTAQTAAFTRYDYSAVGLSFSVPEDWTHNGLSTTTKAAFIKQFGWIYDKPDAGEIWNAVGSFSKVSIDSTLIPSDSAYTIHHLTIFVSRANTLYKQWLCKYRRDNILEPRPVIKEDDWLFREQRIDDLELPFGLSSAYGLYYEYAGKNAPLPTVGHVFSFLHQERCFDIRLESTTAALKQYAALHDQILASMKLIPY